ncbi:hypothetical protein DYD21_05905 [Rhodohalobacter sp. SW132]|uniref:DUF5683 domain-containing protein n=1 Tax=Rhodohalobacter sp. SW132 TaxID=2293433 RepID=UPI000E21DDB1|nr:DUF5683 domain-containing protein [Rhodohalobacter sp. SW132]REL38141.1 hypothetical protein DYD21_05905 [Rhodohalobacter sp. SW132]
MKIGSGFFLLLICSNAVMGQQTFIQKDYTLFEYRVSEKLSPADTAQPEREEYPDPTSVLYKSLMVPGWGQLVNRQAWKIPIVYGIFAGIGYYTYTIHTDYRDYKAAYYNAQRGADTDFRFGPTPDYLQGVSNNQLLQNRNDLRNRRDLMFLVMFLAYGLNALDAYVFAHMRSFDVSDDLSATTTISPDFLADRAPGLKLSIQLNRK